MKIILGYRARNTSSMLAPKIARDVPYRVTGRPGTARFWVPHSRTGARRFGLLRAVPMWVFVVVLLVSPSCPLWRTDAMAAPIDTAPSEGKDSPRERATALGLKLIPGSTKKVEQLVADVDRATKQPTLSRTEERFGIIGTDLGASFEHEGKLYFLFGDTIDRAGTGDAIATTDARSGDEGVRIDFVAGPGERWLKLTPPGVSMGTNEVPLAGVSVGGKIYMMVRTNRQAGRSQGADIAKLVRVDLDARRFEVLRDVSRLPQGRFIQVSLHHATKPIRGLPGEGPSVLMWGTGAYRKSNAYLAVTPAASFTSGQGTRYFAGLDAAGEPAWTTDESRAAPLFDQPTMGDLSVSFVPQVGLWVMLYDAWPGRPDRPDAGIQLRTAPTPWGPWSPAEPVLRPMEAVRAKLIHMANSDDGLEWPMKKFDGRSRNPEQGAIYAPYVIERFTRVEGDRLTLYYTLSTWNPYVVLLMRSEFSIGQ